MLKRVLVKTVMKYKTTLIMILLLLIILFSILNREQVKVVENISNINTGKKFIEITAFIDSTNNATAKHGVIKAFYELQSKYGENSKIIFKTHPIKDYIAWFSTEKLLGPSVAQDKRSPEVILTEVKNIAPIVVISILDKTKGDTIAKGAVRELKGMILKGSQPGDITAVIDSIPEHMAVNAITEEPFVK
jgi:hypothetical protein